MANLDDISLAIGKLNAQYEDGIRQIGRLMRMVDAMDTKQDEMRSVMHTIAQRTEDLEERLAKAESTIEDYKQLKQRGLGVVAFVGFIAAGGATVISKWLNL